MNRFTRCVSFVALTVGLGYSLPAHTEFEVASVKLEPLPKVPIMPIMKGGPGTKSPGRFECAHVSLMALILKAYDLLTDQVVAPDWLLVEKYSVEAIVPQGTTKQEFSQMLQHLLAQRFGLITAPDQRIFTVYQLVTAKGGPKVRRSPQVGQEKRDADDPEAPPVRIGEDKDGCPQLAPGTQGAAGNAGGNNCMSYRRCTMATFAQRLALLAAMDTGAYYNYPSPLHVTDKTGLQGEFDFELKYALPFHPPAAVPDQSSNTGQSIFEAIETQLGLKLVKSKEPLSILLVKHVVKTPTDN